MARPRAQIDQRQPNGPRRARDVGPKSAVRENIFLNDEQRILPVVRIPGYRTLWARLRIGNEVDGSNIHSKLYGKLKYQWVRPDEPYEDVQALKELAVQSENYGSIIQLGVCGLMKVENGLAEQYEEAWGVWNKRQAGITSGGREARERIAAALDARGIDPSHAPFFEESEETVEHEGFTTYGERGAGMHIDGDTV